MKKWYSVLLVLFVSSLSARSFKMKRFEHAIKDINRKRIQLLLKTVERRKLSIADKKELYADLHDCAADNVDELTARKHIYFNFSDFGKTVLGSCMTLGGALVAMGPVKLHYAYRTIGGVCAVLGGILFYKGFTCSTQRHWIARMQELEKEFGAHYDELAQDERAQKEEQHAQDETQKEV